jgi:hypothetical protein
MSNTTSWTRAQYDLSSYAGKRVFVQFQLITLATPSVPAAGTSTTSEFARPTDPESVRRSNPGALAGSE